MANNDLKIKIIGTLNTGKSIGEINDAIKGIEKKINKLKLKVEVDEGVLKSFASFTKTFSKLDNSFNNTTSNIIKGNNIQLKSISEVGDGYEKLTKKVEKYNAEQKKVSETVTLADKNNIKTKTITTNDKGKLVGFTESYNAEKELQLKQKALQEEQKLIEHLANAREKSTIKQREEERKLAEQQAKAINKNLELTQKEKQQEAEKTKQLEHQLDLLRKQANINAQNLQRTHGGFVDNNAIQQYLNSVNSLTSKTPNLNREMQNLNMQFREISTNAKSSAGAMQQSGMSFKEMFSTAMTKFPVWMLSATLFYAPLRAMESMVSRLIEIDGLMVDINRVMDVPDFKLTDILNNAVGVADELSSKLTDVLKITGEFARMGDYSESQLVDMTKTAQVLQNISDLDAKASVDTLTAAMLNFNITAEDSVKISDQLNEVDNNFAISTKDLSDGLRKSASTAKTFGVEMEDLVGYIAAIGSTTRESGAIIGK